MGFWLPTSCTTLPRLKFAELGGKYVELPELLHSADIISLHCPLTPLHLIRKSDHPDETWRLSHQHQSGALVNMQPRWGLKSRKSGALGLDVYEQEADACSLKIFRTKSFRMMSVC